MSTKDLSDYIEDFVNKENGEELNNYKNENPTITASEEEICAVEDVSNVEATPYFVESEQRTGSPAELLDGDDFKKAVERQLSESGKISTIDYEVDSNKIMIQDLKSSVVSLKVSTSRIEREVKDLSDTVGRFNSEKKALDNSLVDLEFRFNELVTHEDGDLGTSTKPCVSQVEEEKFQNQFKNVIEKLEGKVHQMDERIHTIDKQNMQVKSLSQEIERHEKMVEGIKRMLAHQETELAKITELKVQPVPVNTAPIGKCKSSCSTNTAILQNKINEFIAKTEVNERSIATAWVGLVAALLLIPIAWIMGRFF